MMKTSFHLMLAASTLASPLLDSQTSQSSCVTTDISAGRAADIRAAFTSSRIISDTVPDFTPTTDLHVRYVTKEENLGNSFTVLETAIKPSISLDPETNYNPTTTKYTYIQIDLDAPNPNSPALRLVLHNLIYDLQPSCIAEQHQQTQAPYLPLTPLSVASHRYVSLLYRQPGNFKPPSLNLVEGASRIRFDLKRYVRDGGLVLVGGNFLMEGATVSV